MVRMDSLDWGGRRIGLGMCKKDGEGVWWNNRHPLMQILLMAWAGELNVGRSRKDGVARKEIKVLGGWGLGGKRH